MRFERRLYSPRTGRWPDRRPGIDARRARTTTLALCNGTPGIGLARLAALTLVEAPEVRDDLEAALRTCEEAPLRDIDHLCCGNFGRLEVQLVASVRLSRPALRRAALEKAARLVERASRRGGFSLLDGDARGVSNPALFLGTSGIGYGLLRLAAPERVPSILSWD
jgi:lantibiotic modifying enzyme